MDNYWVEEFRERMERFVASHPAAAGQCSVSIKLRPVSGCFCSSCSPTAYAIIRKQEYHGRKQRLVVEEHETGPEILLWVSIAVVAVGLVKEAIGLTTAILNARAQCRHRGDRSGGPVKVIVRTIRQDGDYREEEAIEVACTDPVTEIEIEEALTSATRRMLDGQGQLTVSQKAVRKSPPRLRPTCVKTPNKRK